METELQTRAKKTLFARIWDMQYGRTSPFHLYDAAKNSKQFVQKLQLQTKIPVHTGCVNSICWNDSGKYLLSGSDDQRLSIVHGYDYSVLAYIQTGHRANIFSAKFLPNTNDSHVVSCSGDGIIIYSDLERPDTSIHNKFNCHIGTAYEIMTVPNDPNSFLSCGEDRTVRWFDLRAKSSCANSNCKEDVLINCRSAVTSIAVNPLMPYQLAVGCADASVRLFDRRMLGTHTTGNVTSNGLQALMTCFTVPEFTQNRRITSLCYSGDGQEMLVSYSSDYIYLFDVRDDLEKTPRFLSCDSPSDDPDNDYGVYMRGPSLMRRLRVRGDWSDTGPNARPEAESRAPGSAEPAAGEATSARANRVRWMTDVLARMFNTPTRARSTVSQSPSDPSLLSSQSAAGDAEASNQEQGAASSEDRKQDQDPSGGQPSTSRASNLGLKKFSQKTKDRLRSIACCSHGGASSCPSFSAMPGREPSKPQTPESSEPGPSSRTSDAAVKVPRASQMEGTDWSLTGPEQASQNESLTAEAKTEDPNSSLQNLEQELVARRSDLMEKHHTEPMVNLHYSGQSVSSGLITMDVTNASATNERQWHEQSCDTRQNLDNSSSISSSNRNEANDEVSTADVSRTDDAIDSSTEVKSSTISLAQQPPEGASLPSTVGEEDSESDVDQAVQSIQVSESVAADSDLAQSSSSNTAEGDDVALMMEVDSWDMDSDDDLVRPTTPEMNSATKRTCNDGNASDPLLGSLEDEATQEEKRRRKEEAHMSNVGRPRVKRKYTGHRNARTMIKEATFWGNNFVMSGSDCGHIFIWDRLSTELVMMMEADHHVVNCLQPHPFDPILASSGIDYDIKLWAPTREEPLFDVEKANEMIKRNEVMLEETKDTITVPATFMIRMLDTLNHFRFGQSWSSARAARNAARSPNTDSSNR